MIEIIIIILSIVYVWDYSGFIFDLNKFIYTKLNPDKKYKGQSIPKPFSCSNCMIMWIVLFYALFALNLGVIYSVGIAVASSFSGLFVSKIMGLIIRLINKIQ